MRPTPSSGFAAPVPPAPVRPFFRRRLDRAALRAMAITLALGLVDLGGGEGVGLGAAWAQVAPPVNLGAAGLTVQARLWLWDGTSWEAASVDGLTITDLGTGEYTVAGLPTATGDERYTLQLATAAAPAAALAEYTYGAVPGQRIVWRQELELPPQPLTFKRHDTYGSVSVVIRRRLPAAACEPETTVAFTLINQATSAVAVDAATAELSNCELDATTSTYGATLTYDWQAGDLAAAGSYLGEFTVCYAVGSCHTLPADNRLLLRVLPDFDGQ
jgi:hypothetical protein